MNKIIDHYFDQSTSNSRAGLAVCNEGPISVRSSGAASHLVRQAKCAKLYICMVLNSQISNYGRKDYASTKAIKQLVGISIMAGIFYCLHGKPKRVFCSP